MPLAERIAVRLQQPPQHGRLESCPEPRDGEGAPDQVMLSRLPHLDEPNHRPPPSTLESPAAPALSAPTVAGITASIR
jgi:hypothetical protein